MIACAKSCIVDLALLNLANRDVIEVTTKEVTLVFTVRATYLKTSNAVKARLSR